MSSSDRQTQQSEILFSMFRFLIIWCTYKLAAMNIFLLLSQKRFWIIWCRDEIPSIKIIFLLLSHLSNSYSHLSYSLPLQLHPKSMLLESKSTFCCPHLYTRHLGHSKTPRQLLKKVLLPCWTLWQLKDLKY